VLGPRPHLNSSSFVPTVARVSAQLSPCTIIPRPPPTVRRRYLCLATTWTNNAPYGGPKQLARHNGDTFICFIHCPRNENIQHSLITPLEWNATTVATSIVPTAEILCFSPRGSTGTGCLSSNTSTCFRQPGSHRSFRPMFEVAIASKKWVPSLP
jgi:hypothetical protein